MRKKARFRTICGFSMFIPAFGFFIWVVAGRPGDAGYTFLYFLGGMIFWGATLFGVFIWVSGATQVYKDAFKEGIVREIIMSHNPRWKYYPDSHLSEMDYDKSEIFKQSVDKFEGDDMVKGFEGETPFTFSELHTEYKTESTDSKGHTTTSWHTIFKGIFLFAEFNKSIQSKTFIFPDHMPSFLGRIGQKLQSWHKGHGEIVKLENPEFEKKYVVYSSNQIEARYILTPKIMENLIEFHEKWDKEVHVSFLGQRMYFAVSFTKNLFEPRIFSSGVRQSDLEEINGVLELVSSVIAEMDLNTRIWTVE